MPAERTIPYQPALDGIRAVAVAAVMLYHGDFGFDPGAFFSVTMFFTLSGFLITSLLVREGEPSRPDRRRSLLHPSRSTPPAGEPGVPRRRLPCSPQEGAFHAASAGCARDALGALLQVFNWVKLGSGESYADLTTAASGLRHPLDHYWSLSIEEQFYWVWPLAVFGLVRLAGRRPRWTVLRERRRAVRRPLQSPRP